MMLSEINIVGCMLKNGGVAFARPDDSLLLDDVYFNRQVWLGTRAPVVASDSALPPQPLDYLLEDSPARGPEQVLHAAVEATRTAPAVRRVPGESGQHTVKGRVVPEALDEGAYERFRDRGLAVGSRPALLCQEELLRMERPVGVP